MRLRSSLADPLRAAVTARLERLAADDVMARLWRADPTLWKPDDATHQALIAGALGWLTVFDDVRDQLDGLSALVDEVRAEGYRHAVLLGMGGSSLAPEVMARVTGPAEGFLDLRVLDSTDPGAVLAVERGVDLEHTLFVVASKSGGTTETACFHAYFLDRLRALDGDHAGRHFVAITDEDTSLQHAAVAQGFRAVFVNPADIGGRYSALSFFGLVPAALMGVDLEALVTGAAGVAAACGGDSPAAADPAALLGVTMAVAASCGRDKLTLVCEPPLQPFGAWVEQLVAESTGKEGVGVVPVDLEELGPPTLYGDDRLFVALRPAGMTEPATSRWLGALSDGGHPLLELELDERDGLGAAFLVWELAVAVAGHVLGIDPFDQPNVQEAKDATKEVLAGYAASGELPDGVPGGEGRVAFPVHDKDLPDALRVFLRRAQPGDYVALQAYVCPGEAMWTALQEVRLAVRDRHRVATTLGYGPRFLHSTGQLHKGGPDNGLFLQLIGHDPEDVEVPGEPYSFVVLKRAQARGDLAALRRRGRRVLRVCLGDDAVAGARRLREMVASD